jgi:hypothetical protein
MSSAGDDRREIPEIEDQSRNVLRDQRHAFSPSSLHHREGVARAALSWAAASDVKLNASVVALSIDIIRRLIMF